ncbi:MAG: YicC/YloC family endoribonuclease [Deltaproteobacteria bacterium]
MSSFSSMTGQGSAHAEVVGLAGVRVVTEIRCVNHRYLDVRVRAPGALATHAHAAEDVLRRRLGRGRSELALTIEGERALPRLDLDRAAAAFEQLVALRDRIAPREPLPLSLLAQVPDLFVTVDESASPEALREAVVRATEAAVADVEAMRLREGAALALDLEGRLGEVLALLARIEARLPEVVASARVRLHERITRLVEPTAGLDAARLEHEVALFADRTDVAEECTRLRAHVEEVRRVLHTAMDGRGKRLDFLCQELAREANTLGQKSADAAIAARVIDLKQEIERMREQAQNIL